jgi:adenine phosphoribosyltransferase
MTGRDPHTERSIDMPHTARDVTSVDPTLPLDRRVALTVRGYPDFPSPGILFQDLCPVFAEPQLRRSIGSAIAERFRGGFDRVLAVEARGFVVGALVADASDRPLVLARKKGKLPGTLLSAAYALEYGTAVLELQHDAFGAGERVLVVDDVLATGGTLAAAASLVTEAGATVAGFGVVLELAALGGVARLSPTPVFSVLTVA